MNSAQFVDQSQCYLCQSTQRTPELELGTEEGELNLRWVRCDKCKLVYLDPRPSQHALSVLYDSQGYWQGDSGYKDYLSEEQWRGRQAKDRAKWFVKNLHQRLDEKNLRVLEVGSAAGYFLEELARLDVTARGLDTSRSMVRISDQRTNKDVSVSHGFVEESHFPKGSFQGLAAWGCDSNFNDILTTFEKFSEWLAPNGLLTFNFHDHDHWASILRGRFKMMPNALYFLNSQHIEKILSKFGFEIISMKTEICWMNLAGVYHHTGHPWLRPLAQTSLARIPIRMPIPGGYRVLAQKRAD